MTGLDVPEFTALFEQARQSVFRWEARPQYAVPGDDASLKAFRDGTARPVRSVRTSPWLARIATQTMRGVDWSRVRVVGEELTEYDRWSLLAYVESQAVGERIGMVGRGVVAALDVDFWLIDGGTDDAVAVAMRYDDDGHLVSRDPVQDRALLADLAEAQRAAWEIADPLNVWLAGRQVARA